MRKISIILCFLVSLQCMGQKDTCSLLRYKQNNAVENIGFLFLGGGTMFWYFTKSGNYGQHTNKWSYPIITLGGVYITLGGLKQKKCIRKWK